jgi:valyl-tRNA synthetase
MSDMMPKAYDPDQVEPRINRYWLDEEIMSAEVDPDREPFCIVIPPPNVTGALHMGHALDVTIQDLLIRWRRMQGRCALWLPGTDHAGIATQNVVEKILADEGKTRHDLGREAFIERIWQVKDDHHGQIVEQLRRLGASCDWSRERFTLDEGLSRAVREAFVTMHEQGLIYRGARMINWCPRCATGLSDLEVEHEDHAGSLWHIRYPAADGGPGVVVATTRPETMLGDTGVAVHPDDERYRELVGKNLVLPLMDREIPVVADDVVEMEFGTGAVKVTPAHDPNDLEIAVRCNLPSVVVIGDDAVMTAEAGSYAGLTREDARTRIVADLDEQGLLVQVEDYTHSVGHCSRCHTIVEPLVSTQWFMKMDQLAAEGLRAVDEELVRFVPERWTKVYRDWLDNIEDWCISRQLWWGHQVPAWRCADCGEWTVSREDPTECSACGGGNLERSEDVLDTWFSSGLWPFSTLGWPDETEDLEYFYPTSVLVTAYDIIFFWVARMIMDGIHFTGKQPFADVFIHGLVRTSEGRKMSKSLGTGVDPLELLDQYGADALRFALCQLITHGQDIRYSEDRVVGARNFCNKLWNVTRFVVMNLEGALDDVDLKSAELSLADRWILSRHHKMLARLDEALEGYSLGQGADALYEHVWSEFCDWYVELAKPDLYNDEDAGRRGVVQAVLRETLGGILRALHPFMPFITDELWHRLDPEAGSIAVAEFPIADETLFDDEAGAAMGLVQEMVGGIRVLRAALTLSPQQRAPVTIIAGDAGMLELLENQAQGLSALGMVDDLTLLASGAAAPDDCLVATVAGAQVFLHVPGSVDVAAEVARIDKDLARLAGDVGVSEKKLGNPKFTDNAPAEVVEQQRQRLADNQEALAQLQERREALSGLM